MNSFNSAGGTFTHPCGVSVSVQAPSLGIASRVWTAGAALAQAFCDREPSFLPSVHGKRVLELGSGTGFTAAVMMQLGAVVVATELPDAVGLLASNLSAAARPDAHGVTCPSTVVPLSWGTRLPSQLVSQAADQFDLVVGADITYMRPNLRPLLVTLLQVTTPSSIVVITHSCNRAFGSEEVLSVFGQFFDFEVAKLPKVWGEDVMLLVGRRSSVADSEMFLREWFASDEARSHISYEEMLKSALGAEVVDAMLYDTPCGPAPPVPHELAGGPE